MQDKKLKFQNILAQIIKQHRLENNISLSRISDEIGLTKSVWFEIENGNRDPQLSTLWKIAEGLNIPLSQIIAEMEIYIQKYYFLEN